MDKKVDKKENNYKKEKDLSKVEYSPIVKKLYKYNGQI